MALDKPIHLGRLENVPVRDVWVNEQLKFTPWLKRHITCVSEKIGVDIQDVETESDVGQYSVDLVGKIAGTDDLVVIESQYGVTDHEHMGKILTYMAGKDAKIGIWIAEEFRDEHIATLDYLNRNIKQGGPAFFAVKLELKKIGDSRPAPDFIVVAEPNDFQRNLSRAFLSEADKKLANTRVEFFTKLADKYKEANPSWNKVKAQPQHWLSFGAGKTGLSFNWTFRSTKGWRFAIELYIDQQNREENKGILRELEHIREEIEKELGFSLDFQELPERRASRIEFSKQTSGAITKLDDGEKSELIVWGTEKMGIFSKVMSDYIKKLD